MSDFAHSLAVIIGIDRYQNGIPTLSTAVNDARELGQLLSQRHGYEPRVLLDDAATLARLNQLLTQELSCAHALAFSPGGKLLAAGGWSTSLVPWNMRPEAWIQHACMVVNDESRSRWGELMSVTALIDRLLKPAPGCAGSKTRSSAG